jgi:hypothetical protein
MTPGSKFLRDVCYEPVYRFLQDNDPDHTVRYDKIDDDTDDGILVSVFEKGVDITDWKFLNINIRVTPNMTLDALMLRGNYEIIRKRGMRNVRHPNYSSCAREISQHSDDVPSLQDVAREFYPPGVTMVTIDSEITVFSRALYESLLGALTEEEAVDQRLTLKDEATHKYLFSMEACVSGHMEFEWYVSNFFRAF